jgi:glycerophosphoryl diester phosphodiesterase
MFSLRLAAALLFALPALSCTAFDLQGHRGARGLAPENTLPGFDRALAVGVSSVELDIALTRDGVVVISHDTRLNPAITRDATGRWLTEEGPCIRDMTFGQLLAYDVGRINPDSGYAKTFWEQEPVDGTRIPTLSLLFKRVQALGAGHLRFNIETKISPQDDTASVEQMTDALLRVIRNAGMQKRVSIESFDWRSLRRVQQLEPGIPTAYLTRRSAKNDMLSDGTWTAGMRLADYGGNVARMVKASGASIWSPFHTGLTEAQVREARALGLFVMPWTVNDAGTMETLLNWGVDGIITDYPDRLREVMRRRGMPLPPVIQIENRGE